MHDDKSHAAATYTLNHWIRCVEGTEDLPDHLRVWHYGFIDDHQAIQHQLGQLIDAATSVIPHEPIDLQVHQKQYPLSAFIAEVEPGSRLSEPILL